jgi:hypothetical protein
MRATTSVWRDAEVRSAILIVGLYQDQLGTGPNRRE